jgi:hypothetical protein
LVIDADAHVVECARTWDFMDKSEQQHRPVRWRPAKRPDVRQQFWVIDGKVRGFRFPAFSDEELAKRQQQVGRKFADQQESASWATSICAWSIMDKTGVDVQVLHNTMFIESCAERPAVDVRIVQELESLARRHLAAKQQPVALVLHAAAAQHADALDQIRWSKAERRRARVACGPWKAIVCSPIHSFTRSTTRRSSSIWRSPFTSPTATPG